MGSAAIQGKLWSQGAREWSERQEKLHLPLYRGALEALSPVAGKKLLDGGCGSGLFLQLARQAGALVSGVDAAEGLVKIASKRVPDAEVITGEIEELPFESGGFDVVTAFNATQYAADPRQALRELGRVCRPQGRVLVGQWADADRCQTEQVFVRLRQLAPPPPDAPKPLALSGAGQLEARMVEAKLRPVAWGETPAPFDYPTLEDAWKAMASAGPIFRVIEAVGAERTKQTVLDAFKSGLRPDGSVHHENVFRWVIAER